RPPHEERPAKGRERPPRRAPPRTGMRGDRAAGGARSGPSARCAIPPPCPAEPRPYTETLAQTAGRLGAPGQRSPTRGPVTSCLALALVYCRSSPSTCWNVGRLVDGNVFGSSPGTKPVVAAFSRHRLGSA